MGRTRQLLARCSLAAASLTLCSTGPAVGMCMGPSVVLSPRAGAELPENPRLFLFVPTYFESDPWTPRVRAWSSQGSVALEVFFVSSQPSMDVYQLEVLIKAGAVLTISVEHPGDERQVLVSAYTVTRAYRDRASRFERMESEVEVTGCSPQRSQNLVLSTYDQAPAYRVDWWVKNPNHIGPPRSAVLPPTMNWFYGVDADLHYKDVLELGNSRCVGPTTGWDTETPISVRITRLDLDGSEQMVLGGPIHVPPPSRTPVFRRMGSILGEALGRMLRVAVFRTE